MHMRSCMLPRRLRRLDALLDGIMFVFYSGLPHIKSLQSSEALDPNGPSSNKDWLSCSRKPVSCPINGTYSRVQQYDYTEHSSANLDI